MKAKAITIRGNTVSELGFSVLLDSHRTVENNFELERFDATIPDQVDALMEKHKLVWSWVWSGSRFDEKSGIKMHAYGTKNPKRRMACFFSHFLLWKECVETQQPILILEHDALFVKKFDYQYVLDSKYGAIGINDPRGATRRANVFHDIVQSSKEEILPCPIIDDMKIAQGLAGASAYVIKPRAAEKVIQCCYDFGAMPNDAVLCQQLLPKELGVTKKYYTKVQGLLSTTSSID